MFSLGNIQNLSLLGLRIFEYLNIQIKNKSGKKKTRPLKKRRNTCLQIIQVNPLVISNSSIHPSGFQNMTQLIVPRYLIQTL